MSIQDKGAWRQGLKLAAFVALITISVSAWADLLWQFRSAENIAPATIFQLTDIPCLNACMVESNGDMTLCVKRCRY